MLYIGLKLFLWDTFFENTDGFRILCSGGGARVTLQQVAVKLRFSDKIPK